MASFVYSHNKTLAENALKKNTHITPPKGNHRHCHQESRCKTQGDYVPTKRIIKNPEAAEALLKAIKGTSVYKYAEDFAKVFNSQ